MTTDPRLPHHPGDAEAETPRSTAKKAGVGDLKAKKSKNVKGGSFIPGLNPVVTAVSSGVKSVASLPTPASNGRR